MSIRYIFVGVHVRYMDWIRITARDEGVPVTQIMRDSIKILNPTDASRLLGHRLEGAKVVWEAPPDPALANVLNARGLDVPAIAFGEQSREKWLSQQVDILQRHNKILRNIVASLVAAYDEANKIYEAHQDADPDDQGLWWEEFEEFVLNFETTRKEMPQLPPNP